MMRLVGAPAGSPRPCRRGVSGEVGRDPPLAADGRYARAPSPAAAAAVAAQGGRPPHPPPLPGGCPPRRSVRRRRAASAVAAAAAAAAAAVAAAAATARVAAQSAELDAVFRTSADRVVRIAEAARQALEPPNPCALVDALASCGCSYSPCSSRLPDSLTCGTEFGSAGRHCDGSGCGESKSDWMNSYVLPGRGQAFADGATSTAVARDVCLTKGMDRSVFRSLTSAKQATYFATSNGAMRFHPGRGGTVVQSYDQCGGTFEARLRPWYSAASSGPKDVVIAVDASAVMTQPLADGSLTPRWTLAAAAVEDVLDTLNPRDFVAIVRSDGGPDGAVTVGATGSLMEAVSDERVGALKKAIQAVKPAGDLNVAATMRAAFGLLTRSAAASGGRPGRASAGCSRVVIWITGGRDACYSRPACQPGAPNGPCTCTRDVLTELTSLQNSLTAAADGGLPRAMVTTMTVGDLVDDSLARQLACASSGTWARVTSKDLSSKNSPSSTDVTGYYRMLSVARWAPRISVEQVVFSRLYEGAGDMGNMTTATIPVFSRFSRRVIGVAGADIPVSRLLASAPNATWEDLVSEVASRAPRCKDGDLSANIHPCDMQHLRGPSAACAPDRPPPAQQCFRYGSDLYVAPSETTSRRSWDAAQAFCAALGVGGSLAPVTSERLSQLLTPLSDVDGTWVGVRRGEGSAAAGEWVSPSGAPMRYTSWTVEPLREACVAIDRRGLVSNWSARKCGGALPFICVLPGAAATTPVPTVCGAAPVTALDAAPANRSNPLTATDECEATATAPTCNGPAPAVNTKPFCPLGLESGNTACDNTCCPGCRCLALGPQSEGSSRIGAGAVVGIVVGVLVLVILACVGIIVWRRRAEGRRRADDDASDDDEYYVMRRSEEKSEKNFVYDGDDGGRPPTDAEAAYHGRQLEHATQPGEGVGTRVWSWSPGTFFAPRRQT